MSTFINPESSWMGGLDPNALFNLSANRPNKKGKTKMAKAQGKEMAAGNKTIPKTPKNPKGGAKTMGPKKGGGKGGMKDKAAC